MREASGRSYCDAADVLHMRDEASQPRALVHWLLLFCLACAAARHGDLLEASLKGDTAAVTRLIDEGGKPNVVDRQGRTPLHAAALGGHREVAVQLLGAGANPEVVDAAGHTALSIATFRGNTEIVAALLDHGADMERAGANGLPPLHIAALAGHVGVSSLLLDRGATPDNGNNSGHLTPLHIAATHGHLKVASLLLRRGVAMDTVDVRGYSSLHAASAAGDTAMAALLLKHSRSATNAEESKESMFRASKGFSPLHAAAHAGHAEVIALLLDQAAADADTTVDAATHEDLETPLKLAAARGHAAAAYAPPPPPPPRLNTPATLHMSCQYEACFIPRAPSATRVLPILSVCAPSSCHGRRTLLARGASIHAVDVDGCTPLHGASAGGQATMAALLIEHGAMIDAMDDDGCTALHAAVADGHSDVVALLLRSGVRLDVESVDGTTPGQLAADILVERLHIFLTRDADAGLSGSEGWRRAALADLRASASPAALDDASDDLARRALARLLVHRSAFDARQAGEDDGIGDGLRALFDSFRQLRAAYGVGGALGVARLLHPQANQPTDHRLALALLHRLLDESTGGPARCRRVSASSSTMTDAIKWRVPTIIAHAGRDAKRLIKPWRSQREVLQRVQELRYTGAAGLAGETALSSAVISRIRSKPTTVAQLLALPNQTMNFISYNRELAAALIPAMDLLPPALSTLSQSLRSRRRAVSLGTRGQTAFMHRHYMAIFTQTCGSKGWVLAPPSYPRALLEEGEMTIMGSAQGGKRLCSPFNVRSARSAAPAGDDATANSSVGLGLTTCVVREGESLVVPGVSSLTNWWHGTCNLDKWTAGFTLFTRAPARVREAVGTPPQHVPAPKPPLAAMEQTQKLVIPPEAPLAQTGQPSEWPPAEPPVLQDQGFSQQCPEWPSAELRSLCAWLASGGAALPKLLPRMALGAGVGFFATRAIAPGELLLSVPRALILSDDAAKETLAPVFRDAALADALQHGPNAHVARLALTLLVELQRGNASAWAPYLHTLPRRLSMPIMLGPDDMRMARRELAGSSYLRSLDGLDGFGQQLDTWLKTACAAHPSILPPEVFTLARLRWAMSIVRSRALTASLAPSAAGANGGRTMVMVPLLDLINHEFVSPPPGSPPSSSPDPAPRSPEPLARAAPPPDDQAARGPSRFNADLGQYELSAQRDFGAGEEVRWQYDAMPNIVLWHSYGFTMSDNPHNLLFVEMPPPNVSVDAEEAASQMLERVTAYLQRAHGAVHSKAHLRAHGLLPEATRLRARFAALTDAELPHAEPRLLSGEPVSERNERSSLLLIEDLATRLVQRLPASAPSPEAALPAEIDGKAVKGGMHGSGGTLGTSQLLERSLAQLQRDERAILTHTRIVTRQALDRLEAASAVEPQPATSATSTEAWACADRHPRCYGWATRDALCTRLPAFMHLDCAASCGLCPHAPPPTDPCAPPESDALQGGSSLAPGSIRTVFERATTFRHARPTRQTSEPPIVTLDTFLSATEAAGIVELAESIGFHPSGSGCSGILALCNMGYLQCSENVACRSSPVMQELEARMRNLLGVPLENCEGLGLFRYRPGETFRYHHDQPKRVAADAPGGPRVWAAYVFLSEVEAGGEFAFPSLNLSIAPKSGRALMVCAALNKCSTPLPLPSTHTHAGFCICRN